jgi:diguanylate cyclase (GGDEF)-like protein
MSSRRHLVVSLAPAALALVTLGVLESLSGDEAVGGVPAAAAWLTLCLLISMAVASLHRPLGGSTLGLGAAAVPLAILAAGPVGAAWLAAAGYALGGLGRRVLRQLSPTAPDERRGLVRLVEGAGRAALATLGAAWLWSLAGGWGDAASNPSERIGWAGGLGWPSATAGGAGYLLVFALLIVLATRIRRPRQRLHPLHLAAPLLLDLAGWILGALLTAAGALELAAGRGPAVAAALLGGFALLSLEASRLGLLQGAFERRAVDLERVSQASRRMAASGFGLAGVAVQIRAECLRVIEADYFQLELELGGGDEDAARDTKSWWIGPDGAIHGGAPAPGPSPPPLPGIHRRRSWEVIERELEIDGRRLARIRLWCDPRRIEPGQVEILDRLVPQLGAWVHRALLDREAREDPLTGVPVRRLLERALADSFARCRETGGTLSVLMCDLDHFKRINDTFGHGAGDRALKAVAQTLEAHRREGDTLARYGGEEFAVLLDRTGGAEALEVAERLRKAVETLALEERERSIELRISLGVAAFPELWAAAPGELLALADEALYEAKRRGRNRALLNLGQGRFRTVKGKVVEREGGGDGSVEAPRIFA